MRPSRSLSTKQVTWLKPKPWVILSFLAELSCNQKQSGEPSRPYLGGSAFPTHHGGVLKDQVRGNNNHGLD